MTGPRPLEHYRVEPLSEGIFAGISRPDGLAVCNSGWARSGDGLVLFDTGMTPVSATELRSASERSTGGRVAAVVNSHFHLDHTLGNPVFRGIPVWSTRRTREIMLERASLLEAELARGEAEQQLAAVERRLATARAEGVRSDLEFNAQILRAVLEASGRVEAAPPDSTFETRLELPGRRGAELVSFGSGHTEADALLFFAPERIVFTGDLVVVGVQPSMGSADPIHWLEVLDRLGELGPERLVPGHGPVSGPEAIDTTRDYLTAMIHHAGAPTGARVPTELRPWEGSITFEENLAATRAYFRRPPD